MRRADPPNNSVSCCRRNAPEAAEDRRSRVCGVISLLGRGAGRTGLLLRWAWWADLGPSLQPLAVTPNSCVTLLTSRAFVSLFWLSAEERCGFCTDSSHGQQLLGWDTRRHRRGCSGHQGLNLVPSHPVPPLPSLSSSTGGTHSAFPSRCLCSPWPTGSDTQRCRCWEHQMETQGNKSSSSSLLQWLLMNSWQLSVNFSLPSVPRAFSHGLSCKRKKIPAIILSL